MMSNSFLCRYFAIIKMRTRFPPSPTGFVHVGSLRTALYNYLIASKNKGAFIVRIEDTDQNRYVEGAVENLIKTLEWAGLQYDEGPQLKNGKIEQTGNYGPYIQSQRTDLYRKHAQELLEKDAAYACFCTPERLEEMRQKQTKARQAPMYDRTCLNLKPEEIETKKKAGIPFVIRQKIPRGKTIKFHDLIRGEVSFNSHTIDDQILMKSDNFPTYHLANVVDDHHMEITHVIRGEEWLPSTPKHLFLYEAFGWKPPEFAHLPLLLNKDKTKLSKRQGDVSVEDYRKKGYLKEAIINFIALLGWHPGGGEEQEIFTLEELIEKFSLDHIHKGGAIFDIEKLNWFNFQWAKKIHLEKLKKIATEIEKTVTVEGNEKGEEMFQFQDQKNEQKFLLKRGELLFSMCENHLPSNWKEVPEILLKAFVTIEEKILKTPAEAPTHLGLYFNPKQFQKELVLNPKMKVDESVAKTALAESIDALEKLENFDDQKAIKTCLLGVVKKLKFKNGQVFWPVRAVLTNEQFSPGVFEVIWALGKTETLQRLKRGIEHLK